MVSNEPNGQIPSDLPVRGFGASTLASRMNTNIPGVANSTYNVYVADLNTPWDLHRVTARHNRITVLRWDNESANSFVLADDSGQVEVWHMKELTDWFCMAKTCLPSEMFVQAMFINQGRRTYLNLDKLDCPLKEKFMFKTPPDAASMFVDRNKACLLFISATGLAVMMAYDQDEGEDSPATVDNGRLMRTVRSLGPIRQQIKTAGITFTKSGELIVATTNGDPKSMIKMYSIVPSLEENLIEIVHHGLSMKVQSFAGIYVRTGKDKIENVESSGSADGCQAIVDLCFVVGDDTDSVVIATQHPSGGRVQLWELKEEQLQTHKVFQTNPPGFMSDGVTLLKTVIVPKWEYSETFNGPPAQVICLSSCDTAFQTGRAAACYVTVAYSDGSIQCLLRDSLQQIGSADVPKTGKINDEPSSKTSRNSVTICNMNFSANGNVLVATDSLGQLYMYRMSPVSDPGGPHVQGNIINMLEYCLISGLDWWDIEVCIKQSQVEAICEKLTEEFHGQQPVSNQVFYINRCMAMKSALYRLAMTEETDFRAADCFAHLMLTSIHGVFKSLLRPSDVGITESILDRVSRKYFSDHHTTF